MESGIARHRLRLCRIGSTRRRAAPHGRPAPLAVRRYCRLVTGSSSPKVGRIGLSYLIRTARVRPQPVLLDLPGYPARLAPASDGAAWLAVFAPRSQLIEFVLREDGYRRRMVNEIDPDYWIAPTLANGRSFLEPIQGGALKQMGVLKPWAPSRSYGLVIKLNDDFEPTLSLHSRADGSRHGTTSVLEHSATLLCRQ